MEEALRSLLLTGAAVAAIVGRRGDWGLRAQGSALPAFTLATISGVPKMTYDGPAGLTASRVQVDCWGRTYGDARRLARAIRDRVIGFAGDVAGVSFGGIFVEDSRDLPDADDIGPLFRTSLDLMVWHNS